MPDYNLREYLSMVPSKDKWERVGMRRRAGIMVPLFSIYSKDSVGIGDFSDLELLVNWAQKSGLSIIQLLPLNEVGALFCPYDALSSFALEPLYLSFQVKIDGLKEKFPAGKGRVDYRLKKEKIQAFFELFSAEDGSNRAETEEFKRDNSYWLDDFSLFKALKDHHKDSPWYAWADKYKNRDHAALEEFRKEHAKEILFQTWLQFQLYQELKRVKEYAKEKGILLKGDLPVLVSRDSADVWAHPEFFKLEYAAGAPPDMYCAKGQRWGMPTYNWERIAADGYRYIKEKLRYAENFYDILRIDHAVGLFRIWSIPYHEPLENAGLNGFFDPQDESKWAAQGKNILNVINNSTKMLLCAEDLGVIPQVCTTALKDLGIPGDDVQRWVKDWKTRHDFLRPREYRLLSVAMLSTHDTTNWAAWWEYEAGTTDEGLFIRKCSERGINYDSVKEGLFDLNKSRYGRLRWGKNISSADIFVDILGKRKEEIADFIELYENSYQEKEKLWRQLGLKGPMLEKCGKEIIKAALKMTLASQAIFCVESLIDWLYLSGIFKGEPYEHRINTPGKIGPANWSLTVPLSLDELLKHPLCAEIKKMIKDCAR